jgi:hypothetical protein
VVPARGVAVRPWLNRGRKDTPGPVNRRARWPLRVGVMDGSTEELADAIARLKEVAARRLITHRSAPEYDELVKEEERLVEDVRRLSRDASPDEPMRR